MAIAVESFWRRLRYTRLRDVLRGRFDGQLDWRYTLAEADLPSAISDTISKVVKKTQLWNREQIDVTSELVAHFLDGLESKHSIQLLVTNFGDITQAAVLIRRAKKRNRPLWWRTLRALCWSLGCFLVTYLLLALYLFAERPTLDTDYLAVLNRRAAARTHGESAWPRYRKTMLSLGWRNSQPPQPFTNTWFEDDIAAQLADEDLGPILRKFFTEHQPQLAELREASMAPQLGFTIDQSYRPEDTELLGDWQPKTASNDGPPELIHVLLGHIQVLRHVGILLAGDALIATKSGDAQRAYENLTACLRVAQHLHEPPFLVSGLYSLSTERDAISAMENLLRNHPDLFSDEQLVTIAHAVATIKPPIDYWLDCESLLVFDTMQRIYGNSGRVTHEGALYLNQLANSFDEQIDENAKHRQQILLGVGLPAINLFMASRDELLAKYREIWQQELSRYSQPLWQLTNNASLIDQLSYSSRWEQVKHMPLLLLLPATQAVRMTLERNAGRREGALIGIALELYRREHGDWPESLEQLSPRWLPEVPIDRINGGPLGYHASVDGVVVYSFGSDTDDDDGRSPVGAGEYNVLPPSPITEETSTDNTSDGDWVIWSTVKTDVE